MIGIPKLNTVEYSHKYLKSMFNFLGIEDYQIIRAQGTNLLDTNEVLQKTYREAEEAALRLARNIRR